MAEPYRSAGESSDDPGRPVPVADGDGSTPGSSSPAAEEDVVFVEPAHGDEAPSAAVQPTGTTAEEDAPEPEPERAAAQEATAPAVPAPATAVRSTPPAPVEQQQVLAPADESAPAPPQKAGNRAVATAWVVLAAGVFQVLYVAALALIILLLGGSAAVAPGLANILDYPFAWLPVLFFFLFFELTVLLFNRAGRFAYVVASLVVGFLVYVVSVLLISILVGGGIGDTATLARAFESPEFVLTGLVAREVMLWVGFAIGSRGTRVRRRNREARRHYDEELADGRA